MFLLIPVGVQYSARRYPVVTFTLMGINVALYLVSFLMWLGGLKEGADNEAGNWLIMNLGLIPAESTWYTFLTHMFVHAGFFHILGNMAYLFLFGSCVEDTIGRWQFVLFYIGGGLAAALIYMVAIPSGAAAALGPDAVAPNEIPMVGASGAISACIGGFLLLLAKTKINFRYIIFLFFRLFSGDFWLPAWVVISFWFLSDLFWAIVSFKVPEANDGTAFAAHVGGTLGGIGMMAGWKLVQRWMPAGKDTEEILESMDAHIADDPNEIPTFYLSHDGNQLGPFTRAQVARMISLGSVSRDSFYWRDGMADWQSVKSFSRAA